MGRAEEGLVWAGKLLGEKNTSVQLVLHEHAGATLTPGGLVVQNKGS